jgi:predicted Zn-dependent protease
VSTAEEYQTAQQALQTASAKGIVSSDEALQRCVQNIIDRLAAVTPPTPYPWVIRVLRDERFNAHNVGGGVILLNSGLLRHLETEAQLAYVIGHEMGHQLKGHVVAQESKKRLAGVLIAAGVGVARDPQLAAVAGNIAAGATLAAFSRGQEVEADRIGLNLLNEAGYDPREAVKAAQIMVQVDASGGAPGMFATHPDPVERLANVQGWLSTAWDADYSGRIVSTREFEGVKVTYR